MAILSKKPTFLHILHLNHIEEIHAGTDSWCQELTVLIHILLKKGHTTEDDENGTRRIYAVAEDWLKER